MINITNEVLLLITFPNSTYEPTPSSIIRLLNLHEMFKHFGVVSTSKPGASPNQSGTESLTIETTVPTAGFVLPHLNGLITATPVGADDIYITVVSNIRRADEM